MSKPVAALPLVKGLLGSLSAAGLLVGLAATASAQEPGFPYTDVNCEYTTVYEAPPERAVTLSNNATELMLALGLEDRMAGTSYMGNLQISPQYQEAYETVPVLSPLVATTEELLDAEADFVYAGYPDGFSESRHSRALLHDLGMKTRLNTEGCNAGPVNFETLYEELRSVAAIFGVPERAETVIEDIQARLDAVEEALEGVEPLRVFVYNGGEDAPGATLGHTMLSHVIERAGGENIFADVPNRWGRVSWEQVIEGQPEFIVIFHSGTEGGQLVDDPGEAASRRIDVLNATPMIADVPAIEDQRFFVINSVWGQPGPSSIDAVEALARQFHPEAFAD